MPSSSLSWQQGLAGKNPAISFLTSAENEMTNTSQGQCQKRTLGSLAPKMQSTVLKRYEALAEMRMIEAVRAAITEEMERDERVLVMGEDVGRKGGVFGATDGLYAKFGEARVLDMPLAESGILGVAIGASVAIEAFATLNLLGFGALSGIVGGLANVREMAPLVAGIAFATQAGCRMTAEIGSMRIAEEIDAVEAMGLRPIPFVVGTRVVGGMLCVIPGYTLTLLTSMFISNAMIRVVYAQPGGTYDHYFVQFLSPTDIAYSTIKATVYCLAVTIIHCYYGYFASGGPVGVGEVQIVKNTQIFL